MAVESENVEIIKQDNADNEKKNYAKAVDTEYNEREVDIQELFKHQQLLKRIENDIKLSLPREAFDDIQARTVGFRTYPSKTRPLQFTQKKKMKRYLEF